MPAPHHRLLIRELESLAAAECDRLMVFMPPGSAKSLYAKLFVAWLLVRGDLNIIGASHTGEYAEKISREIQAIIRENRETLGYGLTRDAAELWGTTTGGEYKAAGVGGIITGFRADYAIIDDPVKSREQADSDVFRDKTWAWFNADLRSRAKPDLKIVLIMTRWHEDDLGGRLLHAQGDRWRTVKLPAQAVENDPLGRVSGEWLWDADPAYRYGAELRRQREEYEQNGAIRDWQALFQQNPRPQEGALFKVAMLAMLDAAPVCISAVRSWDLAATRQVGTNDPDWTVGLKLGRTVEGRYIVLDVVRLRGGPDEVEAAIINTAAQDGRGVQIRLSEDPGQAGKAQTLYLTRKLSGYQVTSERETGDKATRAAPVSSQVNVGNVSMVRAPWNVAFRDELASFPSGTHDDIVDGLSGAFAVVGMARAPIRISAAAMARA